MKNIQEDGCQSSYQFLVIRFIDHRVTMNDVPCELLVSSL